MLGKGNASSSREAMPRKNADGEVSGKCSSGNEKILDMKEDKLELAA